VRLRNHLASFGFARTAGTLHSASNATGQQRKHTIRIMSLKGSGKDMRDVLKRNHRRRKKKRKILRVNILRRILRSPGSLLDNNW